jgi:hypothetical protein
VGLASLVWIAFDAPAVAALRALWTDADRAVWLAQNSILAFAPYLLAGAVLTAMLGIEVVTWMRRGTAATSTDDTVAGTAAALCGGAIVCGYVAAGLAWLAKHALLAALSVSSAVAWWTMSPARMLALLTREALAAIVSAAPGLCVLYLVLANGLLLVLTIACALTPSSRRAAAWATGLLIFQLTNLVAFLALS